MTEWQFITLWMLIMVSATDDKTIAFGSFIFAIIGVVVVFIEFRRNDH